MNSLRWRGVRACASGIFGFNPASLQNGRKRTSWCFTALHIWMFITFSTCTKLQNCFVLVYHFLSTPSSHLKIYEVIQVRSTRPWRVASDLKRTSRVLSDWWCLLLWTSWKTTFRFFAWTRMTRAWANWMFIAGDIASVHRCNLLAHLS